MKTTHVIAIFLSSLVIGAFFIWFLADGQSPVELIKPTQYSSQREIGASAYEKLREHLSSKKLLIVGIPPQPEMYQEIVFGFIEKLAAADPKLIVLKEPKWPALPADINVENYDFVFSDDDLSVEAQTVQRALDEGRTILIYSVNVFSTHLIHNNPMMRFEKQIGRPVSAMTIGQLSLRHGTEHKNDPKCVGSMRDDQGLYELGCAQLANGRKHYRELLPLDKLTAILVEQSENDYLLQVYLPSKN